MGFNKRFLTIDSISSVLEKSFEIFNRYMTSADSYICEDSESSQIWNEYIELDKESRLTFYLDLREKYLITK